jgi:exopolyphosphatase/guanosine-5'-triphosphate,3'-diphosphate pyrophosphatase
MQARMDNRDVRKDTVTALASRFATDPDYPRSVLDTSARLLQATGSTWSLDHSDHQQLLLWAAELHEIGLMINYDNAHQHAAYIVRNTIMPGFTHGQQAALAYLLLSHREKVFSGRKIPHLIPCSREILLRLSVLLRLAIMLNRCRLPTQFALQLQASELGLKVCFSSAWKPLQCLLEADLQQEQQYWNSVKLRLEWSFT